MRLCAPRVQYKRTSERVHFDQPSAILDGGGGGGKDKVSQRVEVRLYVKLPKMWGMGKKEIFLPISFSSFYITVNFKHGRDI